MKVRISVIVRVGFKTIVYECDRQRQRPFIARFLTQLMNVSRVEYVILFLRWQLKDGHPWVQ